MINMPSSMTTQRPDYEDSVNIVRDHNTHQQPMRMSTGTKVSDPKERKRDQNRIAQRTYRKAYT